MKPILPFKIVVIILFTSCLTITAQEDNNTIMTVFVHGTVRPPKLTFASLIRIMRDKIDNSLYSLAAQYIRNDPVFYQGQAMQGLGLQKIDLSFNSPHTTAQTIAMMYNLQNEHLGIEAQKQLYYTFGWSGLLSDSKRLAEAETLYKELQTELANLAQQSIYPKIRIVAYSHGGNLVLYLPTVKNNNPLYATHSFAIDELITLATPIQTLTDYLVTDDIFKKVYHLYSTEDNVQIWDFMSSQQFFSKRRFTQRKEFALPKKIQQIRVRMTKKVRWKHTIQDSIEPYQILEQPRVRLIHKDPGHTEMWTFKWAAYWYRDNFPLKPLPIMTLIPTIVHTVNQGPPLDHLTFDYAPGENSILLHHKKAKPFKQTYPYLTADLQKSLWQLAKQYRPANYSIETQEERIALALQKARDDLLKIRKYRRPHSRTLASYIERINSGYFDSLPEIKKRNTIYLAQAH